MIDTIALTLSSSMYTITDPDKFTPSARYSIKAKQNPTKKEVRLGLYKPKLTLSSRMGAYKKIDQVLRIELSLPKLLFGNNLQELRYKDFRPCLDKLMGALEKMGVQVNQSALESAPVSAIHYSKNIALTGGYTPHYFISKIRQANVKLSLDTNQIQYKNDGSSYRWHCKSYEVIFYDKMRDLNKEPRMPSRLLPFRRRQGYAGQARLRKKKKLEILRMEVRLNKRQKIKQLFKSLSIKSALTFKKLFKPAISKKVLLHYIDEIERMRPAWLDHKATNDKELLASLVLNNPTMSAKKIIEMYGLKKILEVMTMRELRTMLGNKRRGWSRVINDAQEVQFFHEPRSLTIIRAALEIFKQLNAIGQL